MRRFFRPTLRRPFPRRRLAMVPPDCLVVLACVPDDGCGTVPGPPVGEERQFTTTRPIDSSAGRCGSVAVLVGRAADGAAEGGGDLVESVADFVHAGGAAPGVGGDALH